MKVEKLATLVACFTVFVTVSAVTSVANEINAQVQATIDASPICAVSHFYLDFKNTH